VKAFPEQASRATVTSEVVAEEALVEEE